MRAGAAAIGLLVLVVGIATAGAQPAPQCSGAQKSWVVADLLFGRTRVSETKWARFLAAEVTPRFPDGFTVLDAKGQWRAPGSQKISRERSKVLMIAMPPDPAGWLTSFLRDGFGDHLHQAGLAGIDGDLEAIRDAADEIGAVVEAGLGWAREPWPVVEHDERGMASVR